jgi:hypothetical protein
MGPVFEFRPLPVQVAFCFLVFIATSLSAAPSIGQSVELRLKLLPGGQGDRGDSYEVALFRFTGELIRISNASALDELHFKHLEPSIYLACIQPGPSNPERCKSVDLFAPPGIRNYTVSAEITCPDPLLNSPGLYTVNVEQLQLPAKARQEFESSVQATLHGSIVSGIDDQALGPVQPADHLHILPVIVPDPNGLQVHSLGVRMRSFHCVPGRQIFHNCHPEALGTGYDTVAGNEKRRLGAITDQPDVNKHPRQKKMVRIGSLDFRQHGTGSDVDRIRGSHDASLKPAVRKG